MFQKFTVKTREVNVTAIDAAAIYIVLMIEKTNMQSYKNTELCLLKVAVKIVMCPNKKYSSELNYLYITCK